MTIKLLSCPVCGSKKLFVYSYYWSGKTKNYNIKCLKCEYQQKSRKSLQSGIKTWNKKIERIEVEVEYAK